MKSLRFSACLLFVFGNVQAQSAVWQPLPEHVQIPIWPGTPPNALPQAEPEFARTVDGDHRVAGKTWTAVKNVSQPTLTVYAPTTGNNGIVIVVFPGGGYQGLAIDLEGSEVCDWLTSRGMTCVLLKYRVPNSGPHYEEKCNCQVTPKYPTALQDAQRTLGLLRLHAAEWQVDPHKIGVLGFSAGGHLVAHISTHFAKRAYPVVDAADKESCRPDFAVSLYPGHLSLAEDSLALNPDIRTHITAQTPPTFLLQNEDDPVDRVENMLSYFAALKKAGVPVEMHSYATGGHAFGLRRTEFQATAWPELVETWLHTIRMLPE